MSVMKCNRGNCENIMCNRYSKTYGYICDECFEELKRSDLPIDIFMQSYKLDSIEILNNNEVLNQEFPLLWQEEIDNGTK